LKLFRSIEGRKMNCDVMSAYGKKAQCLSLARRSFLVEVDEWADAEACDSRL
jgi:hypothetical protein